MFYTTGALIFWHLRNKMKKHPAAARMITALGCFPDARLGMWEGGCIRNGYGVTRCGGKILRPRLRKEPSGRSAYRTDNPDCLYYITFPKWNLVRYCEVQSVPALCRIPLFIVINNWFFMNPHFFFPNIAISHGIRLLFNYYTPQLLINIIQIE